MQMWPIIKIAVHVCSTKLKNPVIQRIDCLRQNSEDHASQGQGYGQWPLRNLNGTQCDRQIFTAS